MYIIVRICNKGTFILDVVVKTENCPFHAIKVYRKNRGVAPLNYLSSKNHTYFFVMLFFLTLITSCALVRTKLNLMAAFLCVCKR
jgi:hypothetical protein